MVTLNPNGFEICRKEEIYFDEIEHLTLINYQHSSKSICQLQTLINFNGIHHLTIDHRMRSGTFYLLLEQLPQLNSLSGQDAAFYSITNKFQNVKVLSLIKSKIRRLSITPATPCRSIRYVSQLSWTFSKIHQLILTIKTTDEIWPWFNHLTDLRSATILARYGSFFRLVDEHKFDQFIYELRSELDLRLWIR